MNNKICNITEKINLLDEKNTIENIDDDNKNTIVNENDNMYKCSGKEDIIQKDPYFHIMKCVK
ncbi:10698_t:CDS:2 [Funneliformis mosseae]|uniref:10698_t:CDS:1 n=1 Tax=Funneliformis mosseae TaxID=27381 RepID=A0A9N9FAI9_FUNMO|nr:10698_t:CDS:2 [Funneliformis mosseae]